MRMVSGSAALLHRKNVLTTLPVRAAVAPEVGKVVHDLVKMSDDTDLSVVNSAMETIVEQYQVELLPVAAELVTHLCSTYMRYVTEVAAKESDVDPTQLEFDDIDTEDNDKSFAAMGVAKTILTVSLPFGVPLPSF